MIIYKATNKINGKIYIGQTTKTLKERIWGHIASSKRFTYFFAKAIKKYGVENFEWEVIEECETIEQLNEREEYWIKELNSINRNIGYNIRIGGKNTLLNEETKKKMSISRRNKNLNNDKIFRLYKKLGSVAKVAKFLNVSQGSITLRLKENNINIIPHPKMLKINSTKVIELYKKLGSVNKISSILKISWRQIKIVLEENNINVPHHKLDLDIDEIIEAYENFKSINKTAKFFNVHCTTIKRRLESNLTKELNLL